MFCYTYAVSQGCLLFPNYLAKPMQAIADTLTLEQGPHLFFLEDLTGSGKTEAAMVLAHRIMAMGDAQDLYIGLPTMATADQMFDRMAESYNRFYQEQACLVLAHGTRTLNQRFVDSIGLENLGEEWGQEWGQEPAGAMCASWLADRSKKALLAAVGVGTVDPWGKPQSRIPGHAFAR